MPVQRKSAFLSFTDSEKKRKKKEKGYTVMDHYNTVGLQIKGKEEKKNIMRCSAAMSLQNSCKAPWHRLDTSGVINGRLPQLRF